jgi:hypothetical protein
LLISIKIPLPPPKNTCTQYLQLRFGKQETAKMSFFNNAPDLKSLGYLIMELSL